MRGEGSSRRIIGHVRKRRSRVLAEPKLRPPQNVDSAAMTVEVFFAYANGHRTNRGDGSSLRTGCMRNKDKCPWAALAHPDETRRRARLGLLCRRPGLR